ncbi:MAG: hypothetical protein LBP59_08240 [Planctomycetaceae bacterium]|nr:hypothetical protein [Planctomycetaceae bacterium]
MTKRIESPPTKLQKEIMKINDNNKLSKLFDIALTCGSIGEFVEFFNKSQPIYSSYLKFSDLKASKPAVRNLGRRR